MFDDILSGPGTIDWLGVRYRTILDTRATGGALSIVDSWSPPLSGPPRHIHDAEDETFIITAGRMRLWLEGEEQVIGLGETAFIPRGREHAFQITADGPARHLIILTPGGFEGFFADMAAGQYEIPRDMGPVNESAVRHHLRITGPPLSAG